MYIYNIIIIHNDYDHNICGAPKFTGNLGPFAASMPFTSQAL